jgi:GNAT superfamily N-acetyltransferase
MPDRASGFCIYDDAALAIARARSDGLRVLYVDLDVHHGDGVQAIHADDPGVLTLSIHESGSFLFPGSGFVEELGTGRAAGTVVNVPLEPPTGEAAWLDAVRMLVPEVAAAFGADLVVSQHGADSHAWDPLAHLRVTTTAMGEAARIVDAVAHRHAGGRWLATGGGGYDAYRVVPRAWALTWLAGAHRGVPAETPPAWRERWEAEATRYRQAPLPSSFIDPANAGVRFDADQEEAEGRSRATAALVRRLVVPRLLREAADRGWWSSSSSPTGAPPIAAGADAQLRYRPAILDRVDAATWARLSLVPRVVAPADPVAAHALLLAALRDGARCTAAVDETRVVGVVVSRWSNELLTNEVLAVGVAPAARRAGLATRLVDAHLGLLRPGEDGLRAEVPVGERDVVEPLDRTERGAVARRLLERARCIVRRASGDLGLADPGALVAIRD